MTTTPSIGRELSCICILIFPPRETFEEVLDSYLSEEMYHYNVVTWLDRLIDAPAQFKEAFVKELRAIDLYN